VEWLKCSSAYLNSNPGTAKKEEEEETLMKFQPFVIYIKLFDALQIHFL
jgi:hypothetical protein